MARTGSQTPTQSRVLPYSKTYVNSAVESYKLSGNELFPWQVEQLDHILAYDDDGLWIHSKYGLEVSRRNGKSEIFVARCLYGLQNGENILYTAHRTDTCHILWERLKGIVESCGIPISSSYRAYGKEHIYLADGGRIEFRTRTSSGGLGSGYDLLIIDEAQEYQTNQESALKYVVSSSKNPQTLYCGTPPTVTSAGTVFVDFRKDVLQNGRPNSGWAEWSVYELHSPYDKDAWYETNPSLGYILTERAILDELSPDELDHNIQRLGYWTEYNLKSAISAKEWELLKTDEVPKFKGKLFAGIKYSASGASVSMSIAVKTGDGKVFVEAIDCQPARNGTGWIIRFLKEADIAKVVVDGKSGSELLAEDMKSAHLKPPILPKVAEVVTANAAFENAITAETICHRNQHSLTQAVTNCEHRAFGGGFGYKSIKEGVDVTLLESLSLAHWICAMSKERRKQRVRY